MLHEWIIIWFHIVKDYGYFGIFILMAMESSIIPIPSELVMPPAAFWAAQGTFNFWGVVLAGTLGSYAGSAASYILAQVLGIPLVRRYGKYFLMPETKLIQAQKWIQTHGAFGILTARLLPVARHLVSIPAGLLHMNFLRFSIMTLVGSFIWCFILSWFGGQVIGDSPELLNSPEEMIHVIKGKFIWFVIAILSGILLYLVFLKSSRRSSRIAEPERLKSF